MSRSHYHQYLCDQLAALLRRNRTWPADLNKTAELMKYNASQLLVTASARAHSYF